jgi:hypothetical protein
MARRQFIAALIGTCLLAPGAQAQSQSVDVAGVKFDNTIQLGGAPLVLNGYGVRYKAVFKVYAAGLYLAARAGSPEAVIASPGAKRIHLVMLRQLDANEFGKILSAGIEKNATREEFVQSLPAILRMGEAAAGHKVLVSGDTMTIDWVPDVGTTLYVKGRAAVGPIKDPAFFSAMAKIWLGRSPADALLKDALLGQTGPGSAGNTYN